MDRKIIALAVSSAAVPLVGAVAMWITWSIAPDGELAANAILWTAGLGGFVVGSWATYALLRHARPWIAAAMVSLVCFPATIVSAASLYAVFVFHGWI